MLAHRSRGSDGGGPEDKDGGQACPPYVLRRRIAATDREIDGLVYELYGLTAEEIAIVEEATAG